MNINSFKICQHLYQIYPNLPQFANDPQQSNIIRDYDLLLKRFSGLYGRQPKYFIRSPATLSIIGEISPYLQMATASISSLQNVVLCIAANGQQNIRFNHYQSAVHSQKIFENESIKWKHDDKNDEYTNILLASLKTFVVLSNSHTLQGVDILIFDDFVHDDHLHSKEALCLGIATALQIFNSSATIFNQQFCFKFLANVANLIGAVKVIDFPIISKYGQVNITDQDKPQLTKSIQFPGKIDIILAHSMTPEPKKLITGKRQNLRICQIQIGIEIIKTQLGATCNISSLNELKHHLSCSTAQLMETVNEYIPKEDLTSQKITQLTQKSMIQLLKAIPFANNVIEENAVYRPYKQLQIDEQLALEKLSTENFIETVQMSHKNGIQLLDIGSEQFNEMILIIKDLAKGWKIVGDGWGGYLFILSEPQKTNHLVNLLINQFYMNANNKLLLSDDVDQYIKVIQKPANGLAVLDPTSQIWY